MAITKTVQSVAQEMLDNLTTKKRGEDTIIVNKENIDWQKDIIFKAHSDRLPSDYIYEYVYNALEVLEQATEGKEDDAIMEIEADIYTSSLTKWLNSSNANVYYLTEALGEYDIKDGFQALAVAQQMQKQEVAREVLQGIRDYIEQ